MRSIVCHKVGIDEQNPELGRAQQLDRIQRQSITFLGHR